MGSYCLTSMGNFRSRAEDYRVRAVELRAVAETVHAQEVKDTLGKIANDYEEMANQVERIGLSASPAKRSK